MKRCSIAFLVGLISACSVPTPGATVVGIDQPEDGAHGAPALTSNGIDEQAGLVTLTKRCAETELQLRCAVAADGSGMPDCRKTSLALRTADGQTRQIAKPSEMSEYTAVGIACTEGNDGASYFVVQYGELPFGCQFCEWQYLYDRNGQQLTHSQPPVLRDPSLPRDDKQYPNHQEFIALHKQLGLSEANMEFLSCDVRVDTRGEPTCLKEVRDVGR